MSTAVEEFVSGCFDELALSQRYIPYVKKAEEAGYPQISKLFRAMAASETVREALFRTRIPGKNTQTCDYYVCPKCGLIYDRECPEQCVADETVGTDFIVIK
jgi:rubrerythrin